MPFRLAVLKYMLMTEVFKPFRALGTVMDPDGRRLVTIEGPKECNRSCAECTVPKRWNMESASSLKETFKQIDKMYQQGYRVLNYVGGEPLAPFKTKEEITFLEHTLGVIEHASQKGMLISVTTNGDFVNEDNLKRLKETGLDILIFSLHSITESGLRYIIDGAKMAAEKRIVPIVSVVFTAERNFVIPQIAEACAQNGILFSTTIVQEKGGGLSSIPEETRIPTLEQRKIVFNRLQVLKGNGFVRNSRKYLDAAKNPDRSWRCDPQKDSFIHVRADGEGEVGVCSEVPTSIQVNELSLESKDWRDEKQKLVKQCTGCLYSCTFESQNLNIIGELPTAIIVLLIKSGNIKLAEMLGRRTVRREFHGDKMLLEPEEALFVDDPPLKPLDIIKGKLTLPGIGMMLGGVVAAGFSTPQLSMVSLTMGWGLINMGLFNTIVKYKKREKARNNAIKIALASKDEKQSLSDFQAVLNSRRKAV